MSQPAVQLLLVEDNIVDREGLRRALWRHGIDNPVHDATDGIEALSILRGTDGRDRLRRPYVILLDLSMPRMNGVEFLRELRADSELHDSIVFVLTTSRREDDKAAAYGENVAGYMVKSDAGPGFAEIVDLLECYFQVVELPQEHR